jgi:hypothetical protein
MPYVEHEAYKASLNFQRKRIDAKNKILDEGRLLTPEEVEERIQGYRERAEAFEGDYQRADRGRKTVEEELSRRREEDKTFKIVSASFGLHTRWHNVVDDLGKVERGQEHVIVTPNAFRTGDPYVGAFKQLIIIYRDTDGQFHSVFANEGDTIRRDGSVLTLIPGDASIHEAKVAEDKDKHRLAGGRQHG